MFIKEKPEPYLATVSKMLIAEGMNAAAEVLRMSIPEIENTGCDFWDGSITNWKIYLLLEPPVYMRFEAERETIERQIDRRLRQVLEQYPSDRYELTIVPKVNLHPKTRHIKGGVSLEARQNIIDCLKIEQVSWSGTLEDTEFLQRIYDLESLPSHDSRFDNATADIWQHRINNHDWDDDWVYDDSRFDLLHGPTDTFLRFLCEVVHPVVRPDRDESRKLVQYFNDQLQLEGWQIVEEGKIAGRPCFAARQMRSEGSQLVSRAHSVAAALDADWMKNEIERLENAVERDPALAIGTAKDLVETCCKSILSDRGVQVPRGANLPKLTKLLAKELKLVPEGISDEAKGAETIRLILSNLSALTQYLAELRGLYGSGHGRDGKHRGLGPRHARLAAGAAITFIEFITETHHQRGN